MRLLATLLIICSLYSCARIPKPNTDLCVINAPGQHLSCWNLKTDYNDNGQIKPGVKPKIKVANSLNDVNKFIVTDPDGFAELKAYIKLLREEYQRCEKGR